MTSTTTPTAIDNYFNCWNEPNDAKRLELIKAAWTHDARSVDPLADVAGHLAISEMMGAVQQQFPGHRFQLVGEAASHHDVLHWSWELVDGDGAKVIGGIDVAHLNADGRIRDLKGFFNGGPS
jgi:hypothetical protein